MYNPKQIAFILYNNRSMEGAVSNFLPRYKFDPDRLFELESMFEWCDRAYKDPQTVAVNSSELAMDAPDVIVTPGMLSLCADALDESRQFLYKEGSELRWLRQRGIGDDVTIMNKFGSLSYIVNKYPDMLPTLGVSIHPALKPILSDDLTDGGILMPLYRGDKLYNCTVRRIADVGKLKYTQACPDLDVWGLDGPGEYWISEGIIDAAAIRKAGKPLSASVSSAMWSMPQLIQLMDQATSINIFVDNDRVGLRSGAVLKRFFKMQGIPCRTYISEHAKDPGEHFFERGLSWDSVKEIDITLSMIGSAPDMTFNFTKYLKNRNF